MMSDQVARRAAVSSSHGGISSRAGRFHSLSLLVLYDCTISHWVAIVTLVLVIPSVAVVAMIYYDKAPLRLLLAQQYRFCPFLHFSLPSNCCGYYVTFEAALVAEV